MDGEGNMQADGGMAAVEPQPLGGEAADYTNLQSGKISHLQNGCCHLKTAVKKLFDAL